MFLGGNYIFLYTFKFNGLTEKHVTVRIIVLNKTFQEAFRDVLAEAVDC